MTLIKAQVAIAASDAAPADVAVNDVYHTVDTGFPLTSPDYDNHAQEILDAFTGHAAGYGAFNVYSTRKVTVTLYDHADPKPRPPKAMKSLTPIGVNFDTNAKMSPAQVALCLSFFAGRNLPHQRGRIYIGPWPGYTSSLGMILAARPTATQMDSIKALGHALFDIGGADVSHVVYSPTQDATHEVTEYWVDDRWDTQRRRLVKASSRSVLVP